VKLGKKAQEGGGGGDVEWRLTGIHLRSDGGREVEEGGGRSKETTRVRFLLEAGSSDKTKKGNKKRDGRAPDKGQKLENATSPKIRRQWSTANKKKREETEIRKAPDCGTRYARKARGSRRKGPKVSHRQADPENPLLKSATKGAVADGGRGGGRGGGGNGGGFYEIPRDVKRETLEKM